MFASFVFLAFSLFFMFYGLRMFFAKTAKPFLSGLLSFWLFSRFFLGLFDYLIAHGFDTDFSFILKFAIPIFYAAPACGFLYLKAMAYDQNKLRPVDYLHLIPVFLYIIEMFFLYFLSPVNWDQIALELGRTKNIAVVFDVGFMPSSFHFWFKILLTLVYLILSWDALFRSGLMKIKGWGNFRKKWLFLAVTKVNLFYLVIILETFSQTEILFATHFVFISQILYICAIILSLVFTYLFLKDPEVIYGYTLLGEELKETSAKLKRYLLTNFNEVNSSPPEIDTVLLLENIMLREKFFLLPKFDHVMKSLAQSSYLSVDKCSRSINKTQGLNIPDWVNKYRVDYFIQSFPEKSRINTIDAIALESGFSSKSTFYRAFKKEKGMTPSDYFNKN